MNVRTAVLDDSDIESISIYVSFADGLLTRYSKAKSLIFSR